MIRNKLKLISLIILLVISLLAPIVNAENEVKVEATTTDQVNPISETQEKITIKEGDEYLFQENVTINNPIDGNLFVFANTVTINSQIGGDAFIFANTINIEENGYILSNLFAFANTIQVKGAVYNIYSIGNTLTIDGFVYRDIRSVSNSLNINGMIGRNVFINCYDIHFKEKSAENATITSYGTIQGDLNYFSDKEITIPEDAVSGETNFTSFKNNNHSADFSTYMYSLGTLLVSAIIIWLLGLWISPRFTHNTEKTLTFKKALQIIGLGILVPIVIILLAFIILLIPITAQFTMLLLCLLFVLFFISTSVTIISINDIVYNKLKITQNIHKLGFLILTAFVFWLLTLIPYLGTVISLVAIIWGIGNISYKIFIKEKNDEKNSYPEGKKEKVKSKIKKENTTDESTTAKEENKSDKTAKDQKQNKETDKNK